MSSILNRLWRKGKRCLKNLDISAIALADLPATGHKFSVVKNTDKDLGKKLEDFLPEDEDREKLVEIAGKLPKEEQIKFQKNLDTIIELESVLPGDLFESARNLVAESLAAAALGPAGNEASLISIEKTISAYSDDFDEDTEAAVSFFQELAKSGLPNVNYENPEDEEEEDEGPGYVSRYGADYKAGDPVLTEEQAIALTKNAAPLFPSLQMIAPAEVISKGRSLQFVGPNLFKADEADEDPEDELTPAEENVLLKAEIKKLKRSQSHQIPSYFDTEEEIEKGEEFIWSSLISE